MQILRRHKSRRTNRVDLSLRFLKTAATCTTNGKKKSFCILPSYLKDKNGGRKKTPQIENNFKELLNVLIQKISS